MRPEDVHQEVERGKQPGEHAVAGEVAVDGSPGSGRVPADVDEAEDQIPEQHPRNEVDRQGERHDALECFLDDPNDLGASASQARLDLKHQAPCFRPGKVEHKRS